MNQDVGISLEELRGFDRVGIVPAYAGNGVSSDAYVQRLVEREFGDLGNVDISQERNGTVKVKVENSDNPILVFSNQFMDNGDVGNLADMYEKGLNREGFQVNRRNLNGAVILASRPMEASFSYGDYVGGNLNG